MRWLFAAAMFALLILLFGQYAAASPAAAQSPATVFKGLFDASQHLEEIEKYVEASYTWPRDLMAWDWFSGAEMYTKACRASDVPVKPYDLNLGDDILTSKGFWAALEDACRLQEGGP